MEKKYTVGIDIGGQTAKIGIVDREGNILKRQVIGSNDTTSAQQFVENLCTTVEQLLQPDFSKDEIVGIGIGAPNSCYYTGTIEGAPNLTWAKGKVVPLAKLIAERINLPVTLTNDANAAAMGEMIYGAARGMKDFIMITLGTGVGSGIVIDGKMVYGHDGFAGELGHICMVREGGRLCGCGKQGCLEAYASAIGVARTARELLETTTRESLLRQLPIDKITSKDVFEAAEQGDEVAKEIFDFTGHMLGEAFADYVIFSAPEAIILFGGLTRAGHWIMRPIVESLNEHLMPIWKNKIKVQFSELKESDAAILGASALAVK